MADYRQRLADRLEHERTKKSLSQDDLALRSGVSPKTIKRIEERKIDNPRMVTIRRLAEGLGIEPDQLRPPVELEEDQLNRIEALLSEPLATAEAVEAMEGKLDQILDQQAELLAMASEVRDEQERLRRLQEPGEHGREATGS